MKIHKIIFFTLIVFIPSIVLSQTQTAQYYNVTSGNGNGLRFWSSNNYKISMGSSSEYKYGSVTDFSIKMSMNDNNSRGWTWGKVGLEPIAAISASGQMKIKGSFTTESRINSNSYRPLTGDWEIYRSGEHLLFREPEDNNKVWASFIDDKALHLQGTPNLWVNGKIGVGNTTPSASLHVKFNGYASSNDYTMKVEADCNDCSAGAWYPFYIGGPSQNIRMGVVGGEASFANDPYNFTSSKLIVNGKIGVYSRNGSSLSYTRIAPGQIFTDVNSESLFIKKDNNTLQNLTISKLFTSGIELENNFLVKNNGFVYARQIEVKATGNFPDYVFADDYRLRSLEDVEAFIDENHHLPEVPSAKEVEDNGHNLAEMDEILLKKVEELTLYIIELKKENEKLSSRMSELEKGSE